MSATETQPVVCPECDKTLSSKVALDRHRESQHGIERTPSRATASGESRKVRGGAKTQQDLARAHLGLSIAIVGFTNGSVLANTEAVDLLEKQSQDWAAAMYAVARQDQRIMNAIDSAMRAGVWAALFAQTAGSVLTVAAMSGKIVVPYGAAVFLVPELASMMVQEQPAPPPAPPAGANGAQGGTEGA